MRSVSSNTIIVLLIGSFVVVVILFLALLPAISHAETHREPITKEDQNAKAWELVMVAKVIAAESCDQGGTGMAAVANVIANRAKAWHKTPYQIVTAKNQFFGYTNKNRDLIYKGCKETAEYLAQNLMSLPDITHGALYFRQPIERIQKWHGEETVRIREHIFHLERKS